MNPLNSKSIITTLFATRKLELLGSLRGKHGEHASPASVSSALSQVDCYLWVSCHRKGGSDIRSNSRMVQREDHGRLDCTLGHYRILYGTLPYSTVFYSLLSHVDLDPVEQGVTDR